jgi:hypothetical protein
MAQYAVINRGALGFARRAPRGIDCSGYFLPDGAKPGFAPPAAATPFGFLFQSAFGFFFSLLLFI